VSPPPQTAQQPQQEPQAAPREVVRELAQPQTRQSRRTRNQRDRTEPPANEAMASTEQGELRAARPQTRKEQRQARREQERQERRYDRRSRDRDDDEAIETRPRSDRRRVERDDRPPRDGERRVIVREDIREPAPRIVRGPEQRDGGFSPFRLFGIFDR
jgi:hypothetical protein